MVFGLFSKEQKLQRIIKKATNQLSQSPERHAAMDKLREDGSEEALFHLLRRFTFSYSKTLEDEQEKEWVVEMMIVKGAAALPPLRRYLKSASQIAYALRILERVANPDTILQIIDDLLADEDPGYTRDTSKRIQLIHWLGDWRAADSATVAQRIIPYLQDFDENTRHAAVEALSHHPVQAAAAPLLAAMLREGEESNRLKLRIAEVLADGGLALGDRQKQLEPLLADLLSDFRIQRDKLVRKA
jgi:HEAT repeat protein